MLRSHNKDQDSKSLWNKWSTAFYVAIMGWGPTARLVVILLTVEVPAVLSLVLLAGRRW